MSTFFQAVRNLAFTVARWMKSKTVTFAIGRGAETALLPKHLNSAEDMVAQVERQLKDIQASLLNASNLFCD